MFFLLYLRWHYTAGLRTAAFNALAYPMAFLEYFSVPHLSRTLFSTWHHDLMSYGRGFDPADFLWVLAGNILSRIIGSIVRVITIAIGIFVSAAAFFARALFLFLWIFLPVLIPFFFLRGLLLLFF
ncbi:MAG: hypothetical protein Q7R73_00950 [bacterium]|nr:hypothetical protein [bacterium]